MPVSQNQRAGHQAETVAVCYLQQHGLALLYRNYQCRCGEIDIIMRDKTMLVFVEVKSRCDDLDLASAQVTYQKQRKLIRTAHFFLMMHPTYRYFASRFDVVALRTQPIEAPKINWHQAAFYDDC